MSLSPSRRKALIAFIKPQKKKFYKAMWKWYGHRGVLLHLRNVMTNPIKDALRSNSQNYGYVSELLVIYQVLLNDMPLPNGLSINELEFIHKKYWERFHKYYVFPRTKKQVPFPHMRKTEAVQEFLARGFVHKDDSVDWRGKKYIIECTIAPLVWPQGYEQHGEACKIAAQVGIPGYTKCPIPNQK